MKFKNLRNREVTNSFYHLLNNLNRINCYNSKSQSIYKETTELTLNHDDYRIWFKRNLLPNTRLIIEPKICGSPLLLLYKQGLCKKAFHKGNTVNTDLIKEIKSIPLEIPIHTDIQIRGEVYGIGQDAKKSNKLSKEYLTTGLNKVGSLNFCSFQILNSNLNHKSELTELTKLCFQVPDNECTKFNINEIEIYRKLWLEGKLFNNYPTNGLVLKVNNKKFQKQLGEVNGCPNWARAIRN